MKKIILFIFLIQISICSAQKKCFCEENKLMNENPINCDTIKLKNNYKLYWQFNCNKIWLTLEKVNNSKVIINEMNSDLFNYTYRLGYQLIKDYPNTLLFRSGCPANGPCIFTLINKKDGKKIKDYIK